MNEYHYFATCVLGWATAPTREEAQRKLIYKFRQELKKITKNCQKRGEPGGYIWSCKVMLPHTEKYHIQSYQPQAEWYEGKNSYITYLTNSQYKVWTNEPSTD